MVKKTLGFPCGVPLTPAGPQRSEFVPLSSTFSSFKRKYWTKGAPTFYGLWTHLITYCWIPVSVTIKSALTYPDKSPLCLNSPLSLQLNQFSHCAWMQLAHLHSWPFDCPSLEILRQSGCMQILDQCLFVVQRDMPTDFPDASLEGGHMLASLGTHLHSWY